MKKTTSAQDFGMYKAERGHKSYSEPTQKKIWGKFVFPFSKKRKLKINGVCTLLEAPCNTLY